MLDKYKDIDINVTDPVFAWAACSPHALAILEQDRLISYGLLCSAVRQAMAQFYEAGWQDGDVIGVSIRGDSALHMVAALALARMGMTQVSLSPSDPASSRLAVAEALGVRAVVTNHEGSRLGAIAQLVPSLDWNSQVPVVLPDRRSPGGNKTWIINQSSGTTGSPKNVEISHARYRMWSDRLKPIFDFLPGERFMSMVSLRFWVGMWRAMCCLSEGGAFVALPDTYSAAQLFNWLDLHHVTYLQCTPLHMHRLLQDVPAGSVRFPGLRILRCGGASLLPTLLQEARTRLTPNVFFSYGANEAGTMTAATPEILGRFPDSVGLPLPGIEFEIVDAGERRVLAGTVGRVRVRSSAGMNSGKEPALIDDWTYPGDTALQNDEGIVFLKGRYDEALNYDGILISPMEIESVLARHPSVLEVAAFALPSPEHQDVPAVALILKQPLTQDELSIYCAEHLGIRAPRVFILVDKLPRNDMGKVLRRQLTEIALQRLSANQKAD